MSYRLIHNTRGRRRTEFIVPLALVAALAVFSFLYPTVLGSIISRAVTPFWHGGLFVSDTFTGAFSFFSSRAVLQGDVERLTAELQQALSLLLDRDLLLEENRLLRGQFGVSASTGDAREGGSLRAASIHAQRRIIAAVLATPPRSPYDTVVIDAGEQDGVAKGDIVIFGQAVLGRISKAYRATSIVELFSSAGKKTPVAVIHDGEAIPVESIGRGGGEFSATLPKGVAVREGDSIIMQGRTPLLFATVEAVETSDTDSFQTLRFKNPVSFPRLRYLEVREERSQEEL